MDARAIAEKSKALMKAIANGEAVSVITGMLNEFRTGVKPTEDLLRSTKIGVTVNRAKAHKNPEVARLAGEIVKRWRTEIERQKSGSPGLQGKRGTANGNATSKTASPAPQGSSQPKSGNGAKTATPPAKPSVASDSRSQKTDKIDTARTGNKSRDNCIGAFYDGLCPFSTLPSSQILSTSTAIEAAIFKAYGPETSEAYKVKIRSLFQNLRNKSNPELRVRVMEGDITPERFVTMTHEELKSKAMKKEDEAIARENMRAAQMPKEEKAINPGFKCNKCGQRKVAYSQMQTRSADEPMTTFCECTNCGNVWKVSRVLCFEGVLSVLGVSKGDLGSYICQRLTGFAVFVMGNCVK